MVTTGNGIIVNDEGPFNPGDIYTYKCKPGYQRGTTTDVIICGADGQWSAQPECIDLGEWTSAILCKNTLLYSIIFAKVKNGNDVVVSC